MKSVVAAARDTGERHRLLETRVEVQYAAWAQLAAVEERRAAALRRDLAALSATVLTRADLDGLRHDRETAADDRADDEYDHLFESATETAKDDDADDDEIPSRTTFEGFPHRPSAAESPPCTGPGPRPIAPRRHPNLQMLTTTTMTGRVPALISPARANTTMMMTRPSPSRLRTIAILDPPDGTTSGCL